MNTGRVTRSGSRSSGAERVLRDERGAALLIAIVLLLLMSALGITALQHAQDEASASGRSRRKDATLYAGEAGLAMVQSNLLSNYNGATMPSFTINEPAIVNDAYGNPIAVRSGRPENAVPEAIGGTGVGIAEAPDGFLINLGNQSAQAFSAVRADIVATDAGNGTVHLQAQYRLHEGGGGGSY
jgi:Tfp pilus assembly protein PilX